MPIHDWTRVSSNTFHSFHLSWATHLKEALNAGRLPESHAALVEQNGPLDSPADAMTYESKRRSVVIRHPEGDRIVAIVEILSPGNKRSRRAIEDFLDKVVASLREGVHLLLVDLFPPSRFDPRGLHELVWQTVAGGDFTPPEDEPLTLAAYRVGSGTTAYVEPTRVGAEPFDMPLFLTPDHYVNAPLAATYDRAFRGLPGVVRRQLLN